MIEVKFLEGVKYQLSETIEIDTGIKGYDVKHDFFRLLPCGYLIIKSGYAWDGASGPTVDDDTNIIQSLVHDVFCQSVFEGLLPKEARVKADLLFYKLLKCKVDTGEGTKKQKMNPMRALIYLAGVRIGAKYWKNPSITEKTVRIYY